MPQYILQRNHTHRSTMGVLSFEAGKPTNVPPFMEKEIIAIGGERLDGEVVDVLDKEPEVKLPPTDTEREEALFAPWPGQSDAEAAGGHRIQQRMAGGADEDEHRRL